MKHRIGHRGPSTLALALCLLAMLASCSGAGPAVPPGTPAAEPSRAEEPAAEAPVAGEPEAAEDEPEAAGEAADDGVEWLVDEEGKRYREHEVERLEGSYRISEDGAWVYLPPGLRYDLARVEEDVLVLKIYDTTRPEESAPEPDDEPAAAAEAEPVPLVADADSDDRLRMERFDRGLPRRGQWRQGFEIADLDGDGHLDIVHGPLRKGATNPLVLLGSSDGTWRYWSDLTYEGPELDYGDVAVADFDGDGHLDLAFAVHLRGILVARGDGQGHFTHWPTDDLEYRVPGEGSEPPPYTSRTVRALDWNDDGRPDLLTLSEGPRMSRPDLPSASRMSEGSWGVGLYLNQGDGRWVRQEGDTLGTVPFGDSLAVGDFDADGETDFATAMHVMGARGILHAGRADGTFEQLPVASLPFGVVTAVEAADFDADGRDDLAVGMSSAAPASDGSGPIRRSVVAVLFARQGGEWEPRILAAEEEWLGVSALGAGDLDGDGHADLVALGGDGSRAVFLGAEGGELRREESPELQPELTGCRGYHAVLTDLNGDGRDEAILAFAGEQGSEIQFARPGAARRCPNGGSIEVWTPSGPGGGA